MARQTNRQATCDERIADQLASRLGYFNELVEAINEPSEDYDEDSIHESPLAVEPIRGIKILLSTGGPADWLEVFYADADCYEPSRIVYHFQDWFDHAERTLEGSEFDGAARYVDALVGEPAYIINEK